MSFSPEQIRAITFDVGHTLIEPRDSVGHVYSAVAAQHGYPGLAPAELDRRFHEAFAAMGWVANTREHWAQLVDATFAGLVAEPPSRTFFPALFAAFGQPLAWHIYDDVRPTLKGLARRGLRLAVISNWDDRLRPLLQALELSAPFEVTIVSSEVGFSKPERGIFELAARRLQLPPEQILHIGDSWSADVEGGRASGFHALQIKRGEAPNADRLDTLETLLTYGPLD